MEDSDENDFHESASFPDKGKHGKDYEVELSAFVFKRLLDMNLPNFKFTREKKGLGKFDDLVFLYEDLSGKKKLNLVQLKHLSTPLKGISYNELAKRKGKAFYLPKYYNYFLRSKEAIGTHTDFEGAKLEALIICTNTTFADDLEGIVVEATSDKAGIFNDYYRLRLSVEDKREIFSENYLSDMEKLVRELTKYIMVGKQFDMKNEEISERVSMIKDYQIPLANEVIDVSNKRFKPSFLKDDLNRNSVLFNFRKYLFKYISDFCSFVKGKNSTDIQMELAIKNKYDLEGLNNRVNAFEAQGPVNFLESLKLRMKQDFGDGEKFPDKFRSFPSDAKEPEEEVDKRIDNFFNYLRFAIKQNNNYETIKSEMETSLYYEYLGSINTWYHDSSVNDKSKTCKRKWVSKRKLIKYAMEIDIVFQGREMKLSELVTDSSIFEPNIMMHAFCGSAINIGQKMEDFGEIKNYYIERTLMRALLIKFEVLEKNESDIFVISNWDERDKNINNITKETQHIYVGNDFGLDDFKSLANSYHERFGWNNVHWVTYENKSSLRWRTTFGSLNQIENFFIKEKESLIEEKESEIGTNNSFVVITGEPGMGKSALVKHIEKSLVEKQLSEQQPDWIISILLKNASDILDRISDYDKIENVVEFLSHFAHTESAFGNTLLKHFLEKEKRLVIFLDGFDELYIEDERKKILQFLSFLKNTCIKKVYVTSRPHFKTDLEDTLGVVSYSIKEITEKEQIYFLTKFWTQNSDQNEERLSHYPKQLIDKINVRISSGERSFLGIPLQTYMFAVAFQDESIKEDPDIPHSFSLFCLFEKFLKKKYEIYLEEKCGENIQNNNKKFKKLQIDMRNYDRMHQDFAFLHGGLFSEEVGQNFVSAVSELDYGIILDIGIISKGNESYAFLHRTFAEHLVSKRLADISLNPEKYNLKTKVALETIILKKENETLRLFFDTQVAKKYTPHKAVMKNDFSAVNDLSEEEINALDPLGRSVCYYAFCYSKMRMVFKLLSKGLIINPNDEFFKMSFCIFLTKFYNREDSIRNIPKMQHEKLGLYILNYVEPCPPQLLDGYELKEEVFAKNWSLVKTLLEKGCVIEEYLTTLLNAFHFEAPLNVVHLILDKKPDCISHCKSHLQSTWFKDIFQPLFAYIINRQDFNPSDLKYLLSRYEQIEKCFKDDFQVYKANWIYDIMEKHFTSFIYLLMSSFKGKRELTKERSDRYTTIVKHHLEHGYSLDYLKFQEKERELVERWSDGVNDFSTLLSDYWLLFYERDSKSLEPKEIPPINETSDLNLDGQEGEQESRIKVSLMFILIFSLGRYLIFLYNKLLDAIGNRNVEMASKCMGVAWKHGWAKAILNCGKNTDGSVQDLAKQMKCDETIELLGSYRRMEEPEKPCSWDNWYKKITNNFFDISEFGSLEGTNEVPKDEVQSYDFGTWEYNELG